MKKSNGTSGRVVASCLFAGLVLGASVCQSAVIETDPADIELGSSRPASVPINIDGAGAGDDGVELSFEVPTSVFDPLGLNHPAASAVTVGASVSALAANTEIGAGSTFNAGGSQTLDPPPFIEGETQYLGVRFTRNTGADTHYGWLELDIVSVFANEIILANITRWAWNDTPDASVFAGVVPELSSTAMALGVLAFAVVGFRRLRSNRAKS